MEPLNQIMVLIKYEQTLFSNTFAFKGKHVGPILFIRIGLCFSKKEMLSGIEMKKLPFSKKISKKKVVFLI